MDAIEQQIDRHMARLARDPLRGLFNGDEWILRKLLHVYVINYTHLRKFVNYTGVVTIGELFMTRLRRHPQSHYEKTGMVYEKWRRSVTKNHMLKNWRKVYAISVTENDTEAQITFDKIPDVVICLPRHLGVIGWWDLHCTKKLIGRFGTPHVDEILTLRLLPQILPQPIAEAIADCMHGVITRRIIEDSSRVYYPWNTPEAWAEEVEFTYIDSYAGESDHIMGFPTNSWEADAHKLRAQYFA